MVWKGWLLMNYFKVIFYETVCKNMLNKCQFQSYWYNFRMIKIDMIYFLSLHWNRLKCIQWIRKTVPTIYKIMLSYVYDAVRIQTYNHAKAMKGLRSRRFMPYRCISVFCDFSIRYRSFCGTPVKTNQSERGRERISRNTANQNTIWN